MSSSPAAPAVADEHELDVLTAATPAGLAWIADGKNQTSDPESGWLPYEHLLMISDELVKVAMGETPRLLITTPPRHGKSMLISETLPPWYFGRFPKRKIILASATATLAEDFSRKGQGLLREHGPDLFGVGVDPSTAAAARWHTSEGGVMIAAGIGGQITGRGAHLLIIDDPIKTAQDAHSEVVRQAHWDWWLAVARTRLMKGAGVVIVLTRWHEDDLAGRILKQAEEVEGAAQWKVLNLPAIAEPDENGKFDDPMGRSQGQPLCPDLKPLEELHEIRAEQGSYWWSAMFQGSPKPVEGMLFKRAQFRYMTIQPPQPGEEGSLGLYLLETDKGVKPVDVGVCPLFQTADTASSESEMADYTVIGTWAVTPERELLLIDVQREKFEDTRLSAFTRSVYQGDAIDTEDELGQLLQKIVKAKKPVRLSVENAASGPKVIKEMGDAGFPIASANPDSDKVTRALLAIARYEQHRVFHLRGRPWLRPFEDELTGFPNAAHDDQVDMVSYAAIELPKIQAEARPQKQTGKTQTGGVLKKRF
jgi:predicted phage terminase large subunit-like protein